MLLEQVEARLQATRRSLARAADFAVLHRLVEEEIGGIKGIGELTVYDIAHRIGAHFGKAPRLVYLHAGTRAGARAFNIKGNSFDPKMLPKAFSPLSPAAFVFIRMTFETVLMDGLVVRSRDAALQ